MKKVKQMGIWMDHSNAILMELSNDMIIESNVESAFTQQEKEYSFGKGEKHLHIKEQHLQSNYFKKLSDTIRNYQEVILFGPTDAKDELLNLLKGNHLFENIKIEARNSDKMSINKKHEFVREYFKQKRHCELSEAISKRELQHSIFVCSIVHYSKNYNKFRQVAQSRLWRDWVYPSSSSLQRSRKLKVMSFQL